MNKYEKLSIWFLSHYEDERTFKEDDLVFLFTGLISKAIPKKPINQEWGYNYQSYGGDYTSAECPNVDCGRHVGSGDNHCSICGQVLDWSKDA
jgi:hypothetical protein